MTQKTISLSEPAYKNLKKLKKVNESFSQLILRLTQSHNPTTLNNLFGIGKQDEDWEEIQKSIQKNRSLNPESRVQFD
ncbi:MAG: antitoxin VapB family protein [Promethearchaeota archaeon]